jgi:cyanophycinase-like exopeptidase
METFINLAGGQGAKIVVISTANGNHNPDGSVTVYNEEAELGPWRRLGIANVRMLHTSDKSVADTEEFVKPLRDADAVWFEGGRQWNIIDSYKGTLTEQAFRDVLARGGVIGGSSAGASVLGDLLIRGAVSSPDVVVAPEAWVNISQLHLKEYPSVIAPGRNRIAQETGVISRLMPYPPIPCAWVTIDSARRTMPETINAASAATNFLIHVEPG